MSCVRISLQVVCVLSWQKEGCLFSVLVCEKLTCVQYWSIYSLWMKSTHLLVSFTHCVVDRHVQLIQNTGVACRNVAAHTERLVFNSTAPGASCGSIWSKREYGKWQRVHDKEEILRRVRRSLTTNDHRITRQMHTRQMQVWLALCQEGYVFPW